MLNLTRNWRPSLPAFLLAALALPGQSLAGELLTIAGDGTADYFSVADAYSAAAEGDTLIVFQTPLDNDVVIDTKGVTLVNEGPNSWRPDSIEIRNLPAGSQFIAHGLIQTSGSFYVVDCDGAVVVTDSLLPGTIVRRSLSVSFDRTRLYGRKVVVGMTHNAGFGLAAVGSDVLLHDCVLRGSKGDPGTCGSGICTSCCVGGSDGAPGLFADGMSRVRVQSSSLKGGPAGGDTVCCTLFSEGYGYSINSPAELTLLQTPTLSNAGNYGAATVLADRPRNATWPRSVESALPFTLEVEGQHGDTVFLLSGGELGFHHSTLRAGILQINASPMRARLRSLPPSGIGTVTLMAPPVPAGDVIKVPLQAVFLRANGDVRFAPAGILNVRGVGVDPW